MLQTRLLVGTLLAILGVGLLVFDAYLEPWYPFLLIVVVGLGMLGTHELLALLDPSWRPLAMICYPAVCCVLAVNWIDPLRPYLGPAGLWLGGRDAWSLILWVFVAVVIVAFLVEMYRYRKPGVSVVRIALTVWVVTYLGLLPTFLAQLRWLEPTSLGLGGSASSAISRSTLALAIAIFVPKSCDIGAYFTGRWFGRHQMSPTLSPKKTWEGAAGGIVCAVLSTVGICRLGLDLPGGLIAEMVLGALLGGAGILGDLAESLIKRDSQQKDAGKLLPGFGGVLDVVDSILFAAPVAYWWLR
jgi:phosphatidate cytidylyltransferase